MSTNLNSIQKLTRYKQWADQKISKSLADLPIEVLQAKQKIVFGSLIATLHHVYLMDIVWKSHLLAIPHNITSRNPIETPTLAKLAESQAAIDTWFIDYADNASNNLFKEVVKFEFIGGGHGAMTREEILQHVVNHTTYHRGHIAAMMYECGAEPPTTDFPVYLRDADGHKLGQNQVN